MVNHEAPVYEIAMVYLMWETQLNKSSTSHQHFGDVFHHAEKNSGSMAMALKFTTSNRIPSCRSMYPAVASDPRSSGISHVIHVTDWANPGKDGLTIPDVLGKCDTNT